MGWRARWRRCLGDPFGGVGRLVAVHVATVILTGLLSTNAAAALMLPGSDGHGGRGWPRFAIVRHRRADRCVLFVPVTDPLQTNLMVYDLGGYKFRDFTTVGAPFSLVTPIVAPIVAPSSSASGLGPPSPGLREPTTVVGFGR